MGRKNWPVSRLMRHSPSPGDTSAFFSPSSVLRMVNPGGILQAPPAVRMGGAVLVLARPGLRSAPVLG